MPRRCASKTGGCGGGLHGHPSRRQRTENIFALVGGGTLFTARLPKRDTARVRPAAIVRGPCVQTPVEALAQAFSDIDHRIFPESHAAERDLAGVEPCALISVETSGPQLSKKPMQSLKIAMRFLKRHREATDNCAVHGIAVEVLTGGRRENFRRGHTDATIIDVRCCSWVAFPLFYRIPIFMGYNKSRHLYSWPPESVQFINFPFER